MTDKTLEAKYVDLARAYFADPNEQHLSAAAKLGRELVSSGVPSEEVGEIHQQAFQRIANEFPDTPLNSAVNLTSAPLLELLMAYGMAFREKVAILEQSQEALGESEGKLRGILETVAEGIISIDGQAHIQLFNPAAEKIFGMSADDVIGKEFSVLTSDEDVGTKIREICAQIGSGREGSLVLGPLEVAGRKHDGSIIPVEVVITEMRLHDQNQAVCLVRDLTDQKHLQSQLFQASKLSSLGEMATGIAHELNQPLNIIRMAAESSIEMLMDDDDLPRDKLKEKFGRIIGQMDRAATIIDHLRSFGRNPTEDAEGIDLKHYVLEAYHMLQEQLRLQEIDVTLEFPDQCPQVKAHPVQLEQVILNLLSNARDAITDRQEQQKNGYKGQIKLKIEASDDADEISIVIEDDAGGFPENALDRVFEPFFTTKEIGKGTGLGLSISYGIITEMGGSIEAENTDTGARLTIKLPKSE